MFQREANEAGHKIRSGFIEFRRKAGYWAPNLLTDRHAMTLLKVCYRPTKSADDVIAQFASLPDSVGIEFIGE